MHAGLEVDIEDPHGVSGTTLRPGASCCSFGPAVCPITRPCCPGSKQKLSWTCGSGLAVCWCSIWHADANLELRFGVHTFGWLQVRGVDTLDGVNGLRIEITPGVGGCARFTGWTWPHGCEKRPDVRAVQSGQMLKSYQTFAMAVGSACLLLKSSCSLIQGELSSQGAHEAKMPKSGRCEGVNRLVHTSIFRQTKSTGTPMYLHLHPQTFRKT